MSYRYVKIKVPTDTYLIKYLMHRFLTDPIVVTKKDTIGHYLTKMVQNYGTDNKKYQHNYQTHIEFFLPLEYLTRYGCYLSPEAINDFNEFLKREFYNDLFNYIEVARRYDPDILIKDATFDFMNKYGITEQEKSFDALKKAYQRDRLRVQKPETQKV